MKKQSPRWWDWPSAMLLCMAILISAWRLSITNWTPNLGYAGRLAALGTILGLALGYSRFERRGIIALSAAYSLVMIPRQLIQVFDPDIELGERLMSLLGRWLSALQEFAYGHPVEDSLFFVSLLSITFWIVGLTAGYQLVRHANFPAAILPAGLLILTFHIYDNAFPQRIWLPAVFLLLSLILLARQNYLLDNRRWKTERVYSSAETGIALGNSALTAAVLSIAIAWSMPSSMPGASPLANLWEAKPWREMTDRLNDAFASVRSEGGNNDFFRDQLLLGDAIPQSDEIVLVVSIPSEALEFPRLYWRGRVYDRFEDKRWETSDTRAYSFSPALDDLPVAEPENSRTVSFTYRILARGQSLVYAASPPGWVSRPVNMLAFANEDGSQDLVALLASPNLQSGETYQSRSALSNPSVAELRGAGQAYPEWVRERYLQLPEDFSPRLRALAEEIAGGFTSPYDRAAAITRHLRENVEYRTEIILPEDVADPIEYAILDLKQGFCNYYASAEVLMLRSLGVPARLAVGYAQGEPNETNDSFVVRRRDAHAWPEVYFPGYGWVEFEPTGNQDEIIRPERPVEETQAADIPLPLPADNAAQPGELNADEQPLTDAQTKGPIEIQTILFIAILLVLGWPAWVLLDRRYKVGRQLPVLVSEAFRKSGSEPPEFLITWARWVQLQPVEKSFHAINLGLRLLGRPMPIHTTPAERAAALREILPPGASNAIDFLAGQYQRSMYGRRPKIHSRKDVIRAARSILWQAVRARVNAEVEKYRSRL